MEAVRFGLFAERAMKLLAEHRAVRDMTVDKHTPDLPAALRAKNDAAEVIPLLEALLYPKDEVDG